MSRDRRAVTRPAGEPWSVVRRFGLGVHKVFIQPWLDAQGNGSIPAWGSGLLFGAVAYRLVAFPSEPGWPVAWVVLSCYVGVAVYESAMTVARLNPERLLEIIASRLGVGDVGRPLAAAFVPDEDLPRRMAPDPE